MKLTNKILLSRSIVESPQYFFDQAIQLRMRLRGINLDPRRNFQRFETRDGPNACQDFLFGRPIVKVTWMACSLQPALCRNFRSADAGHMDHPMGKLSKPIYWCP